MVMFRLLPSSGCPPKVLQEALAAEGIVLVPDAEGNCRVVTHLHVSREDVERVVELMHRVVQAQSSPAAKL